MHRMLRRGVLLALVAAALPLIASPVPSAAAPGLDLRREARLSPRLTEVLVGSPALQRETSFRILTPARFDPARDHLPVLWLLHGGVGDYRNWTDAGQAEALTAGLPLIVVMPDGGAGGWYSDWRTPATLQRAQKWETYHLRELMPFVRTRYGARADRAGNAVAGLSMGGFGAMHYAARHPDVFGFAASFSGAVDLLHPGITAVSFISPLAMQGIPGQIWGDRFLNESVWRAHNPVDLAANLRPVETQLRTGNGMPGGAHGSSYDIQEYGVGEATASLHKRLAALGIGHLYANYGPGAHTWDYWTDDLRATLPRVVAHATEAPPDPATVDHIALEPAFSAWGHDVRLARPVYETAVLSIRPNGFRLRGSGVGSVTTPARYAPGQPVVATITTGGGAPRTLTLIARPDGRLVVPVNLGPANPVDEYPVATVLPPAQVTVDVAL